MDPTESQIWTSGEAPCWTINANQKEKPSGADIQLNLIRRNDGSGLQVIDLEASEGSLGLGRVSDGGTYFKYRINIYCINEL
jgi:hypothetical protein